jgi:hypothetical protein
LWISSVSTTTSYVVIAAQMLVAGSGLGMITAPATEAIIGAVPLEKAGVGSAVNDATRLFGAALGVAVIGSVAASLYGNRLGATIPHDLPATASAAARGSVGGALVAAKALAGAGHAAVAHNLVAAAVGAFLHSLAGALRVGGGVGLAGAVMAALLLPARPRPAEDFVFTEADIEAGIDDIERRWVAGSRRLRATPSSGGDVVGWARGAVRLLQLDGDWAEVGTDDGIGWLRRQFLHDVSPAPADAA